MQDHRLVLPNPSQGGLTPAAVTAGSGFGDPRWPPRQRHKLEPTSSPESSWPPHLAAAAAENAPPAPAAEIQAVVTREAGRDNCCSSHRELGCYFCKSWESNEQLSLTQIPSQATAAPTDSGWQLLHRSWEQMVFGSNAEFVLPVALFPSSPRQNAAIKSIQETRFSLTASGWLWRTQKPASLNILLNSSVFPLTTKSSSFSKRRPSLS